MANYSFSGHESFACKSLWLKKGYDFVVQERDFNAPDAVIYLGDEFSISTQSFIETIKPFLGFYVRLNDYIKHTRKFNHRSTMPVKDKKKSSEQEDSINCILSGNNNVDVCMLLSLLNKKMKGTQND